MVNRRNNRDSILSFPHYKSSPISYISEITHVNKPTI